MLSKKEACKKIAEFYYNERGAAASQDILNLCLHDIQVKDDVVIIYLSRPGLIIGKKAQNIENLQKYLGVNINIIEMDSNVTDLILTYIADMSYVLDE